MSGWRARPARAAGKALAHKLSMQGDPGQRREHWRLDARGRIADLSMMDPDRSTTEPSAAESNPAESSGEEKREYVQQMFSDIAPRYDLLNHLLSANIDKSWRRRAIAGLRWERAPAGSYLDLCAGTLDVGVQLAGMPGFHGHVAAADFAEPMLRAGMEKASGRNVLPIVADALALPFASQSLDGAIVAFGIRNLASLEEGLRETFRVLRPGARFVILEFSTPRAAVVRTAYHAYFHHLLPIVGRAVSGHPTAYRYLPESVERFPEAEDLAGMMRRAGFVNVEWEPLTFGIAALHMGEHPLPAHSAPAPAIAA